MSEISASSQVPTAMFDTVIVIEDPLTTKTEQGVLLPEGHITNKLRTGTIVAVGPGTSYPDGRTVPLTVMVGERIIYGRLTGVLIKYDEGSYLVIAEKEILAIIE